MERQSIGTKDVALESLRGMAALAVVFGHTWITFYDPDGFKIPSLLHILVSGGAAVSFFFVLSGYVLTRRFVVTEDFRYLACSVAKRWFRLAGPVTISFLISAALFRTGLYFYSQVAEELRSPWLAMFGYSIPAAMSFHPSLLDAFIQGSFFVFFVRGHHYYNSPVGTMYFEAMGSFIVFGLAFVSILARRKSMAAMWVLWALSLISAAWFSVYYAAFVAGLGLSLGLNKQRIMPRWIAVACVALAYYLLNYESDTGLFSWFSVLHLSGEGQAYVWMIGAVLLIVGVEFHAGVSKLLSGRIGSFLGRLSFPIYLLHFLVMCSIGCYVWLALVHSYGRAIAMLAIPVTVVVSVIVSLPLISFDRWWVITINRIVYRLMPDKKQVPDTGAPA